MNNGNNNCRFTLKRSSCKARTGKNLAPRDLKTASRTGKCSCGSKMMPEI